jgi:tetratricopeptide (TPR) repeat protein
MEVMVSAPLIVLLYDRTFMAGSFASAWKQRRPWYLALGASWLLLACLVAAGGGTRGTAAGFGVGVASWSYLLKQSEAIVLYLKLSFWPDPLVLDYGTAVARSMLEVWWQGPLVLGLLAGTVWALWRRPAAGFLGAWFFLILAPSSSVLPLAAQTMAEHRMYLPLAAVIAAVGAMTWKVAGSRSAVIWGLLALVAGIFTHRRNTVYHDELTLWSDTTANYPSNPRAWTNLGSALLDADRPGDAVAAFEHAGRLEPDSPETQANLGLACLRLGRLAEAVQHGEVALQLDPANVNAQINLAHALVQSGQAGRAIAYYEAALRAQPGALDVQINLADALLDLGRVAEAMQHYRSALPLESRRAEIRCKLATACIRLHDLAGGRRECSEALRLRPDYAEAHFVWGNLCAAAEDFVPAIAAYRRAVSLEPDHLAARNNLANALLVSQRLGEAIAEYREVLRRRPADRSVQENLQSALDLQAAELGRGK